MYLIAQTFGWNRERIEDEVKAGVAAVDGTEAVLAAFDVEEGPDLAVDQDDVAEEVVVVGDLAVEVAADGGTDVPAVVVRLVRRLDVAKQEVASFGEYDYIVVNDELTSAVDRLRSIVVGERSRLHRMRDVAAVIAKTF